MASSRDSAKPDSDGRKTPTQSDLVQPTAEKLSINIPGQGTADAASHHPDSVPKKKKQADGTPKAASGRRNFHPSNGHGNEGGGRRPHVRSRSSFSSGYNRHYSEFGMSEVEPSNHNDHHGRGPTAHMDSGFDRMTEEPRWETKEEKRLREDEHKLRYWRRWGPYLSERQWATVREDYSAEGDPWNHFPHEIARSRTYRWGEDGIAGISDNHCRMAFSLAFWNGKDRMLKERLFGLANNQGNHGEDVKELYYYLDNTPTHSYMKMLYKYPQEAYPYEQLVRESEMRGRDVTEFEITDTDLFDESKYWDIFIEYAKDEEDENAISVRISAYNRGPEPADLHIIPQLFFKNYWFWPKVTPEKPTLQQVGEGIVQADHPELARKYMYCSSSPAPSAPAPKRGQAPEPVSDEEVQPTLLFTENDTNFERLYGGRNISHYAKDAFHDHIIPGHRLEKDRPQLVRKTRPIKRQVVKTIRKPGNLTRATTAKERPALDERNDEVTLEDAEHQWIEEEIIEEVDDVEEYFEQPTNLEPTRGYVNPDKVGTKCGAHYKFEQVPANGGCAVVRLKLTSQTPDQDPTIDDDELFDNLVEARRSEADEFYTRLASGPVSDDMRNIMRQALAGMLWNKQYYCFIQSEWLAGDPGQPAPPEGRKWIRNTDWKHLHMEDILSMPDKWEYPFPCVWDTAFHTIPLAIVDPWYAKKQLDLFTREWYMKPDGSLPSYEWNFGDVNPPVHAWAVFRVFKIERKMYGREDLDFLERVFQKLLLCFTQFVNKFENGFLGLDNIAPFNRSEQLPVPGTLRQIDGLSWMAFFSLQMLNMSLELAKHNHNYEAMASKFFEHFIWLSESINPSPDSSEMSCWDEEDGFYYDTLQHSPGDAQIIKVRSLVGLMSLFPVLAIEPWVFKRFPSFAARFQWFVQNRPALAARNVMSTSGKRERRLLSVVSKERLKRILEKMLDETEFLSSYGVRSLSKHHQSNPFKAFGDEFAVGYWPGDSQSPMFGGNSNWRGPIWVAPNLLLIESLQRFYQYYGPEELKVECPTGSGDFMDLAQVAEELQHRIISMFTRDARGQRACNAGVAMLDHDPHFRDLVPFHEFFHADTGAGLGASHQCGWTGCVAAMILQSGLTYGVRTPRTPRSTAAHYFDEQLTEADTKSDAGSTSTVPWTNAISRPPSPDEL
ncbi:unnamed protein product [Parajaminaea phylloscopi]